MCGMDLDELQSECEKLLGLLRAREPGLFTWNDYVHLRLTNIVRLAKDAGIEADKPTPYAVIKG